MKITKKFLSSVVLVGALTGFAAAPKYVFLFIGDGMSTPQRMIANEFSIKNGYGPLAMNMLPYHATTRTCSASSLVTDSAAAATAIACGEKTNNGMLGVNPQGEKLESSAVVAKRAGRKVGIATTVTITHATPGGFYAHVRNRGQLEDIGRDLAHSGFDFFAGGGLGVKATEKDTRDTSTIRAELFNLARGEGFSVITNAAQFRAAKSGKVWYHACEAAMPYAIDGDSSMPALSEIVAKGIELLDNPKGFFYMIEGGAIDWMGHANDAAANLREVLALDAAVKVALAFQQKHPADTLVVVTGDHETGGMAMGFAGTGYNLYMDRLAKQTQSTQKFTSALADFTKKNPAAPFAEIKPMLAKTYGFIFDQGESDSQNPMRVSKTELQDLEKAYAKKQLPTAAKLLMSHKAGIGWTSGSHTALPVLTTAKGPHGEKFMGFLDNTDIAKIFKSLYAE